MTRRRIAVLALVAIPLAVAFGLSLRADPPHNAAPTQDLFSGKILVFNERSNPAFEATLEEVRVTHIGDQAYVVGKGVAAEDAKSWYNGRTIWIPLVEVTQIIEFQDRAELIKAAAERRTAGK
jgi:hypothetical protein